MASISHAFPPPHSIAFLLQERTENPQMRSELPEFVRHVKERRHILGLVGGNEVSRSRGNVADLESDLLGITRPNSWDTLRHHLPEHDVDIIKRRNPKKNVIIDARAVHLQEFQQWAYPSVLAPAPLIKESCSRPEKY